MNQFEYVMVLVSIIVGLGIAHMLLGVSGIIVRFMRGKEPLELSLAHAAWPVSGSIVYVRKCYRFGGFISEGWL